METEEDEANPRNPSLPPELITAILVRLPVKYLLQFKCISKSWLTLISSPDFVKAHLSFSAKDYAHHRLLLTIRDYCQLEHGIRHCSVSSLFNDDSVTEILDLDYLMKADNQYVLVVGSVNGLVCLYFRYDGLVVMNPSTRKFKQVADLVHTDRWVYGFGYDEIHDDYKIVAVSSDNFWVNTNIYSLKSDSWKKLDDFQCGFSFDGLPKFVNRKFHWLDTRPDGWGIMSFDLVDEKYRDVELPCYEEIIRHLQFGVVESYFAVFCFFEGDYEINYTDVWVMKEYGVKESWMKLYTIKYPCDDDYFVPFPLCIFKGKIACATMGFNVRPSMFVIYNPEDGSRRYQKVTNIDGYVQAEHYYESLVWPILQNELHVQC